MGAIGVDGKEYAVPSQEHLQQVFGRNKELIDRKMRQGFTLLQLTPIAMPISALVDRAKAALLEHAAAGKLFQTKQNPADADIPVPGNAREPIWIWEKVHQALDTHDLVYFPQAHTERSHQGMTKEQVLHDTRLCAVPGWSVALTEPIPIMPQQGQGQVIGGRRQLEASSTPHEYLQTLSTPTYEGETCWTPEDFLTHFVTQLETTDQVRHDRSDGNPLWLLGVYVPEGGGSRMKSLVLVGYWHRRRLYLSAHRSGNRLRAWVASSMVRLGA